MLFTTTTPASQGDRILLFVDPMDAREEAPDRRTIYEVAVDLDASRRRLRGVGFPEASTDPDWATPAYFEDYGRIMARGPIPGELFAPIPLFPSC